MDSKEMIDKVVAKAKSNPMFLLELKKDPEKAIESVVGIDIPDGMINKDMVDKVLSALKKDGIDGAVDAVKDMMK